MQLLQGAHGSGEMEHILLPKRLLERAGDGELTVSLAAEKGAKE